MTLRIDKDTADAVVKDNVTAGSAINWLRYMEITHSWTKINVDNSGVLTMQAAITGKSRVDGKTAIVNLNYTHEENVFTLWRSLRLATIYRHGLNKIQRCRNLLAGKTRTVRINNENEYCHAVSACVIYRGGLHATY